MGKRSFVLCFMAVAWGVLASCANLDGGHPARAGGKGLSAQRLDALTSYMQSRIDAAHLPGTVMLVSHRGKVVYSKALGSLDPKTGKPMTEDAIFRMYSMSKPVVSVATMILVEEGKLRLNDPVSRHLPELKDQKVRVEKPGLDGKPGFELVAAKPQATVLDLMRHTAGMTYANASGTPVEREYDKTLNGFTDSKEFIRRIGTVPLEYHPGTRWVYSFSHDVLGVVVERVSGKPLHEFLEERIFRPLKMRDTAFVVEPSKHHRIAQPFAVDPDDKRPITMPDPTKMSPMAAGGGSDQVGNNMASTAQDYLRFTEMLRRGGELDGARILSRKGVELIVAENTKGIPGALPPGYGWGLGGTMVRTEAASVQLGTVGEFFWGGWGGTYFVIDPVEELIAIRLSQAPASRGHYNMVFKNMVYSALE